MSPFGYWMAMPSSLNASILPLLAQLPFFRVHILFLLIRASSPTFHLATTQFLYQDIFSLPGILAGNLVLIKVPSGPPRESSKFTALRLDQKVTMSSPGDTQAQISLEDNSLFVRNGDLIFPHFAQDAVDLIQLRNLGPTRLSILSIFLHTQYKTEGNLDDLNRAIEYGQEAFKLMQERSCHRALNLNNLSNHPN